MLTMEELRIVNSLLKKKKDYEAVNRGFESPYVKTSIGLVDLNSASPKNPVPCDEAKLFNNSFEELIKGLNIEAKKHIEHAIKEIDLEISKYIEGDHP